MRDRAIRVLNCLLDAPAMLVEPGGLVETRTSYGIHDEDEDLAFSVGWRDAEGCQWAADFSERALAEAAVSGGSVELRDSEGDSVVLQLLQISEQTHLLPA